MKHPIKNRNEVIQPEKTQTITRSSIFLASLCGVLIFLSFPKYGIGFIAWIAFVPLLIALRKIDSPGRAMFLGWIAGIISWVGLLYWIVWVVVNYGYLPLYLGVIILMLLVFYLSLYFAAFAAGIVYFKGKIPLYIVAPVLWVCLEYLKSKLFTGFPWENLGYSQFNNIQFIQIADITGTFGLSFLIILLNVAIYEIITRRNRRSFSLAAAVLILWSGVYMYGILRMKQIHQILKNAPTQEVSLIQGNISQMIKWKESFQDESIRIHEELSACSPKQAGGLIVWPETAVTTYFQEKTDIQRRIRKLPKTTGNWFLFGAMHLEGEQGKTKYYNSAYLFSPDGTMRGRYDKVHLVPYGEYVPKKDLFPFIHSLASGNDDFTAGKGFDPLRTDTGKIGVLICYEVIFPEIARAYKKAGSDVLVNLTNDAWFDSSSAPYQHLSMSTFRSVETRLYIVRAANTGISAIIDPAGEITARSRLFEKEVVRGNIKFVQLTSFYVQYGDWLVGTCFIVLIFIFSISRIRRKRNV